MPLTTGTRLGTYEIVAPLGAGGMGEVYRAKDLRLARDVALKVLPANMAGDAGRLERFEREARMVAGLNHPNIVTLFSVEDEGDVRFLTMELVEGRGLEQHVAPGGLPLTRVMELGIAIADALTAAHEKGVVHRDLKPANVMLTRDGRVKVLDFGLAKLAAPDSGLEATQMATMAAPLSTEGQVLGTVPYMAPEQVRGESVDARTDVFALGVLVYELATGNRPFTGASSADVGSAILRDTPRPLASVRAGLPGDLDRIVSRCLEKNPRERFQTALDVANELRRVRRTVEQAERAGPAKPAADKIASIAVLPFVNRSASADDEYFSDGLADELINVLAKIRGLRVVARASSFQFKGKNEDLAVIGAKLSVATVLDGSVRKAGNRVRISVQLVKVADSSHVWSETYDRTLDDIFAVQDEIAQSVVKELRTTLLGEEPDSNASGQAKAEVAKAVKGRATDPEAHRLYLLASHLLDRRTREDFAAGIGYLERAVKLDPKFALAEAALGRAYFNSSGHGWRPVDESYRLARQSVDHALLLEPDLAEGHATLGWMLLYYDLDWRAAEVALRRAIELAPGNALVLRYAGTVVGALGRAKESLEFYLRALEKDPLSAPTYNNMALLQLSLGNFEEAVTASRRALELSPANISGHSQLALGLLGLGRGEEALVEVGREPDVVFRRWAKAIVHHALGQRAESDEPLRELIEHDANEAAYQIAEVHAARGEVDRAFEWLERAHVQRDGGLAEMKNSPQLRLLSGDPRWSAFLSKLGLPV